MRIDLDVRSGAYGQGFILDIEDDIVDFDKVMQLIKFDEKDAYEVLFQIVDSMQIIDADGMYKVLQRLPDPNLIANTSYLDNEFHERKLKEVIVKTGLAFHQALTNLGLLDPQFFDEDGVKYVFKKLVNGAPLLVLLPEENKHGNSF